MSTLETLAQQDWNLKDADTDIYSAKIHPYHARFIPQIPERLIESYTEEGDTVLDPFNGSGTTVMVSSAMNRTGVGFDLNPLACLISRVKSHEYAVDELREHAETFVESVEQPVTVAACDETFDTEDWGDTEKEVNGVPVEIPDFADKYGWFLPTVVNQLGAVKYQINTIDEQTLRDNGYTELNPERLHDFYNLCLSAITKKVSRSDEDYTYIGDNMLPGRESNSLVPNDTEHDVYDQFQKRVWNALPRVSKFAEEAQGGAETYNKDSRTITEHLGEGSVDFAVTSPPYANAVDYARYHRLSFYWLGYPVRDTRDDEIGARSKRGRKDAVEDYFEAVRGVYAETYNALKEGSHFAIVVGNSQWRKQEVETIRRTREMCEDIGFNHIGNITRQVSGQSMSQKEIVEEDIIILQK